MGALNLACGAREDPLSPVRVPFLGWWIDKTHVCLRVLKRGDGSTGLPDLSAAWSVFSPSFPLSVRSRLAMFTTESEL